MSLDDACSSATASVYWPVELSVTLKSAFTASAGVIMSFTTTSTLLVPVLPLGSVAVMVTSTSARSAHEKLLMSMVLTTPQLSPEAKCTFATVMLAWPVEFRFTPKLGTACTVGF